jgi:L-ascorbate metabolism protein UlaG (beta-lactamase superfamily)
MDRFSEKQIQIARQREELVARYPALWEKIISEWKSPGPDRAWLTYSANYLFRTGGVRWALDPLTLNWRLKDAAPKVDISDLGDASFILLTHRHEDHLDLDLLATLQHFPICWVVPEPILTKVLEAGIPREKIMIPIPLQPIELNGIRITPFDGQHFETRPDGTRKGVPATSYLIEWAGKRWLIPGDTRTYDASQLPAFGPVDGLLAHLWLGRGSALLEPPPLLEAFCRFLSDLQPDRVILTHLTEFGRAADDYWDKSHAQQVITCYRSMNENIELSYAFTGEAVII